MIIYRETIRGSASYTHLQIVPKSLLNIIFVAFHSNPIGGHFNAYRTLHCLQLQYFWPEMYSYIKKMCHAYPGCAFSNPGDAYKAGSLASFKGNEAYIISCCGMTGFAAMEPVKHATSMSFATAVMKIQLKFGLCHTIVLDKDSKFFGAFKEAGDDQRAWLGVCCHGSDPSPFLRVEQCPHSRCQSFPQFCRSWS